MSDITFETAVLNYADAIQELANAENYARELYDMLRNETQRPSADLALPPHRITSVDVHILTLLQERRAADGAPDDDYPLGIDPEDAFRRMVALGLSPDAEVVLAAQEVADWVEDTIAKQGWRYDSAVEPSGEPKGEDRDERWQAVRKAITDAYYDARNDGLAALSAISIVSAVTKALSETEKSLSDPDRFPQTPEEAITCPHGNQVWFGHECGLCDGYGEGDDEDMVVIHIRVPKGAREEVEADLNLNPYSNGVWVN